MMSGADLEMGVKLSSGSLKQGVQGCSHLRVAASYKLFGFELSKF